MATEIPHELVKRLQNDSVVLFAGSGLSAGSNAPLWATAAERLKVVALDTGSVTREVIDDLATAQPRRVGDVLLPKLSAADRGQFFRTEFSVRELNAAHLALARLQIPRSITTNWDTLIERMYEDLLDDPMPDAPWVSKWSATFTQEDVEQLATSMKDDYPRWVWHLHGVYFRTSTIVWERKRYDDQMARSDIKEHLNRVLRDKTLLYVGFGLKDEDFDLAQRGLQLAQSSAAERHYALLPETVPRHERDDLQDRGIAVIEFPVDPSHGPQALTMGLAQVLTDIGDLVKGRTATSAYNNSRTTKRIARRIEDYLGAGGIRHASDPGLAIYASNGFNFLRGHEDALQSALEQGVLVRFLLLDPAVAVTRPADTTSLTLLDWRAGVAPGTPAGSSEEVRDQEKCLAELKALASRVRTATGLDPNLRLRHSQTFPRESLCLIGSYIYHCPRPIKRLSFQGPAFEYRVGTQEYAFYRKTFDELWDAGVDLVV